MIAATYNLPDAYRGDNYGPISLRIKDSSGNYLDLSGSEVNLHVKNKKNCAIVLSWSSSNGTVDILNNDTIILKEVVSCRMRMPQGIYNYDLQILKDKKIVSYLRGILSVTGDVTGLAFCDCGYNGGSAIRQSSTFRFIDANSFSAQVV
jgi:hypothetical protein